MPGAAGAPDECVDALAAQHVGQPACRALPFGREHHPVLRAHERADAVGERLDVTDHRVERGSRRATGCRVLRAHASTEVVAVGVRASRRSNGSDRRGNSSPFRTPRAGQHVAERGFLVEEVLRAVAHPARLHEQHARTRGQEVREQVLLGGEPRQPRLHAVEHLTLREPLPLLAPPRRLGQQRLGPGANLGRGEELPAREHLDVADVVRAALVADRELGEALHLVAPLVDAHGMLGGGREHVDDGAADGDLAACLHLVLAPVPHPDEPLHELVALDRVTDAQPDGFALLHVRAEALHECAHRGHDDGRSRVAALAQPPHHPESPAHGLERRRHALEGQRLPGREELDLVAAEHRDQVARDALGLGDRRHRDQDRAHPCELVDGGGEEGPGRVGHRHHVGATGRHRDDGVVVREQTRQVCERGIGHHDTLTEPLGPERTPPPCSVTDSSGRRPRNR